LPYSPEYRPVESDEGVLAMERVAQATGGRERVDLAGIWKELPKQPRLIDLTPFLLGVAIVLLLLEVLERRTGMVSRRRLALRRDREESPRVVPIPPKRPAQRITIPAAKATLSQGASKEDSVSKVSDQSKKEEQQIGDALSRARRRAKDRIRSKE